MLAAVTLSAHAQQIVGSVSAPGPNGSLVTVPVIMQAGLGDIAKGWNGVIYVDPLTASLPYEFQQFLFAHEAFHAVWNNASESGADSFAGQILRLKGFTPAQMNAVCQEMLQFLSYSGDMTHPPSAVRVQIVRQAYGM